MAKKKQGGQSLAVTQAIKPIALAKELLPAEARKDQKVVRALADKIIDRNKDVKRGQSIKAGTTVNVGKAQTTLSKYLGKGGQSFALKDPSLNNRFTGFGKIAADPLDFRVGASSVGSDTPAAAAAAAIKTAPIDTVEFVDEALSAELLLDLLFEDVGGQELLTIARNDTVNGQDVVYQPFKNLGILQEIYNPTNLLKLQETSDKIFSNFTINLRDKIPKVGSGLNGANYYLDLTAGDGIIEFINLKSDEQVEIQIVSAGIIEDVGI
jgi:stage V sporulation protein SpoVS